MQEWSRVNPVSTRMRLEGWMIKSEPEIFFPSRKKIIQVIDSCLLDSKEFFEGNLNHSIKSVCVTQATSERISFTVKRSIGLTK